MSVTEGKRTSSAATLTAPPRPSAGELVARAREMIPVLQERNVRCADARRLLPETLADFLAAGIHQIAKPVRFGGMGHDLDVVFDVAMELGRGCGSSGWLGSFMGGHSFEVGWFSEEAQAEYWSNPDALSATASAVVRFSRTEVDEGVVYDGRLKFASGIDYADWVIMSTAQETSLVPRSDFKIVDDWHVYGLRGTGSKSIEFDNIFIPKHRSVSNDLLARGASHGARLYDSPYYKLHRIMSQPYGILSPIIGMAQGVVDLFDARVRVRSDPHTRAPAFERPGNQSRFAESAAEVDLARRLVHANLDELAARGSAGLGNPSLEERARFRRDVAYATRLCVRAVDRLISAGDASALYEPTQIHRLAADVRAGALQFALAWDETAIQFSRVRWGYEPQTPLI